MTAEPPKNEHRGIPGFLVKFFQLALYIPLQVAFIPLAIVGLIVAIFNEMRTSKKLGVSFSAIQALQYRWIMHHFDIRPDPISVAFTKQLPCESHFGLWSTLGALIISQRLFGFTTKFGRLALDGATASQQNRVCASPL
ncbi:MAG: hypothetical protein AMS18_09100 [Gemmatimonas sp. SG8_17]|nr:MAG: hypothetical protein AMS18_09100 [Gemmatimonas sp. SG8_17]